MPTHLSLATHTPSPRPRQLGTNDAKTFNYNNMTINTDYEVFPSNFGSMITTLKSLVPKPLVFVITPPPLYSPFPYEVRLQRFAVKGGLSAHAFLCFLCRFPSFSSSLPVSRPVSLVCPRPHPRALPTYLLPLRR